MPEELPDPEIVALLKEAQDSTPAVQEVTWLALQWYRAAALAAARSCLEYDEKLERIGEARGRLREMIRQLLKASVRDGSNQN